MIRRNVSTYKNTIKGGKELDKIIIRAMAESANEVGVDLMGEAQRSAPKDKGPLRASAGWEIQRDGNVFTTEVYFDKPYAEVQHERLDFKHTVGKAKYLDDVIRAKGDAYRKHFADKIKHALGKGVKK